MERSTSGSNDEIIAILETARRLINEGNPGLALQAVVTALRISAGEQEILPALRRAHEQYLREAKTAAAANELSALFAEACAIAEASSSSSSSTRHHSSSTSRSTPPPTNSNMDFAMDNASSSRLASSISGAPDPRAAPILAESGRMQVVVDASTDGSSFVCHRCGGLVSSARRDEHMAVWCSHLDPAYENQQARSDHYDDSANYMDS